MPYTDGFKSRMIQKLAEPGGPSATQLAREVGVPQSTLSRWLRRASSFRGNEDASLETPRSPMPAKRPQDWTAEEKLQAVVEAAELTEAELGAFLRRQGLHETQLEEWRQQVLASLERPSTRRAKKPTAEARRVRELEREVARKDKALAETAALLVLKKKSRRSGGTRATTRVPRAAGHRDPGRRSRSRRGAPPAGGPASGVDAAYFATLGGAGTRQRRPPPRTRYDAGQQAESGATTAAFGAVANAPAYRDLSPSQIVPRLADEQGVYLASESTLYRLLRHERQLAHRERTRPPTVTRPLECIATGPNQMWSWDICWLPGPVRGTFFYLYLILDVWSRKIVGAAVHEEETSERAAELFRATCRHLGLDPQRLVLHADNGSPMKGATMLATLKRLGVVASFSRPQVSNDNPFSEALFRTLKYRPEYPSKPFASLEAARAWVTGFVNWYNSEHRHSAIRYVTPDERHHGREDDILERRRRIYEAARQAHPERWSGSVRNWTPIATVYLNPEPKTNAMNQAA